MVSLNCFSLCSGLVKRKVDAVEDSVKENLVSISSGKADSVNDKVKEEFKKRKLLQEVVT